MSDGLSATRTTTLRVLGIIFELADGVTFKDVAEEAISARVDEASDLVHVSIEDQFRLLKSQHLIEYWESFDGIGSVQMTARGADIAREFDLMRNSVTRRRVELRDRYLSWVYDQTENLDRNPTPDDFLASGETFYGIPFSEVDLLKAGQWLDKREYIEGPKGWQYAAPLRPTLTTKGIWAVEHGQSVNDEVPEGGVIFNTTVHGSANIAQSSSNVSQSISQTWLAEASDLVNTVEQALPVISPDAAEELSETLGELRKEIANSARPHVIRALFSSLAGVLTGAAAGALGNLLSTQILDYIATLPS